MIRITGARLNRQSIDRRVRESKAFDRGALRAAQEKLKKRKMSCNTLARGGGKICQWLGSRTRSPFVPIISFRFYFFSSFS